MGDFVWVAWALGSRNHPLAAHVLDLLGVAVTQQSVTNASVGRTLVETAATLATKSND